MSEEDLRRFYVDLWRRYAADLQRVGIDPGPEIPIVRSGTAMQLLEDHDIEYRVVEEDE